MQKLVDGQEIPLTSSPAAVPGSAWVVHGAWKGLGRRTR
jgi:hypothetical protein